MKRYIFTLAVMLFAFVASTNSVAGEADSCVNAADKDVCIANLLLSKLDVLITLNGSGGDVKLNKITYYDESDCRVDWATGYIPEKITGNSLHLAESTCHKIAETLAGLSVSNKQVESVKIGSECLPVSIDRKNTTASYNDCFSRAGG